MNVTSRCIHNIEMETDAPMDIDFARISIGHRPNWGSGSDEEHDVVFHDIIPRFLEIVPELELASLPERLVADYNETQDVYRELHRMRQDRLDRCREPGLPSRSSFAGSLDPTESDLSRGRPIRRSRILSGPPLAQTADDETASISSDETASISSDETASISSDETAPISSDETAPISSDEDASEFEGALAQLVETFRFIENELSQGRFPTTAEPAGKLYYDHRHEVVATFANHLSTCPRPTIHDNVQELILSEVLTVMGDELQSIDDSAEIPDADSYRCQFAREICGRDVDFGEAESIIFGFAEEHGGQALYEEECIARIRLEQEIVVPIIRLEAVDAIAREVTDDATGPGHELEWSDEALEALRCGVESYAVDLFEKARLIAGDRVGSRHLRLARQFVA